MMQSSIRAAAFVAMLLAVVVEIRAGILFDNGSASGTDVGRQNSVLYTIYEDFTLSTAAVVDGVEWAEHQSTDPFFGYLSTDLTFFNGTPSQTTLIASFNLVANRSSNGGSELFGLFGFDYSVSGLSLMLVDG